MKTSIVLCALIMCWSSHALAADCSITPSIAECQRHVNAGQTDAVERLNDGETHRASGLILKDKSAAETLLVMERIANTAPPAQARKTSSYAPTRSDRVEITLAF